MSKKLVVIIRNAYAHDFGGAERFAVFQAKALNELGNYKSIVISRNPSLLRFAKLHNTSSVRGWWWSEQDWNGKRALLLPVYIGWQTILTCWYFQLFLRHRPYIIHIQSRDDFIAATLAAKVLKIKTVWTDHADLKHVWKNVRKPFKNPVGKLVFYCAHYPAAISVVSKSEYTLIEKNISNTPQLKKLAIVHNGCSNEKIKYQQKKYNTFTFCIFGRLVIDKGVADAIAAFDKFSLNYNARLMIVGDGPDKKYLKKLAKSKHIEFAGHTDNPLSIVSRSHAVIHPSHHEGFSVALVEASMLGIPIIATAVGGNKEIIHDEKTGLLIPAKSPEHLAQAMLRLMKSPELCARLGREARKNYLENYVFEDVIIPAFIQIYEKPVN